MSLITLRQVTLSYGGMPLLENTELRVEPKERLCIVGRNGAGKSSLLRLICGEAEADTGEINRRQGLRISRLAQTVEAGHADTVYHAVAAGLGPAGALLSEYRQLEAGPSDSHERHTLGRITDLQHQLDAGDGWRSHQRISEILSRLDLDSEQMFSHLSGGMQRRVLLARALAADPDLLLLDEPTNHLDIDAIAWLEEFLGKFVGTLIFVTHDRRMMERLATRIVEIDRGRLTAWPGDYRTYLRRKQAALEAEATQQSLFDKKLAEEETWIRQGIRARRTRNEGRVRALQEMRVQRMSRRTQEGKVRFQTHAGQRSGQLVAELSDVSYQYGQHPLITGLSTTILRGDRIGLIGPNGSGKTTLLRLTLGEVAPQSGTVRLGTRIEIAYFDQHRAQLREDLNVAENVAEGRDRLQINGRERHVISYLQDFLFPPERARGPVSALSGGERNRLLLARMFARPSNLLVMDEPTNDLDIETLELLEELLLAYRGTVLLVSHDRTFLDNVVTSCLVFEGNGRVGEYVGGYEDWLRQRDPSAPAKPTPSKDRLPAAPKPRQQQRKLSYKEQRELEGLPQHITTLEDELNRLHGQLADPKFYREQASEIAEVRTRLEAVHSELELLFERWEQLEAIATSS